jgi:hypothetical protein
MFQYFQVFREVFSNVVYMLLHRKKPLLISIVIQNTNDVLSTSHENLNPFRGIKLSSPK